MTKKPTSASRRNRSTSGGWCCWMVKSSAATRRVGDVRVDTSLCKYSAVRRAADGEEECNADPAEAHVAAAEAGASTSTIFWTDTSVNHQRVSNLGTLQKLNHFLDMTRICRKAQAAALLNRNAWYSPKEFSFVPRDGGGGGKKARRKRPR